MSKKISIRKYGNGITKTFYGNTSTPEQIEKQKKWKKEHYEEYKKKDNAIDVRTRAQNCANSIDFNYALTFSTSNEELRHNPTSLLNSARNYLKFESRIKKRENSFFLILEPYKDISVGWHIHGLSTEPVDLSGWYECLGSYEFSNNHMEKARYLLSECIEINGIDSKESNDLREYIKKHDSYDVSQKCCKDDVVDNECNANGLYCSSIINQEKYVSYITKKVVYSKQILNEMYNKSVRIYCASNLKRKKSSFCSLVEDNNNINISVQSKESVKNDGQNIDILTRKIMKNLFLDGKIQESVYQNHVNNFNINNDIVIEDLESVIYSIKNIYSLINNNNHSAIKERLQNNQTVLENIESYFFDSNMFDYYNTVNDSNKCINQFLNSIYYNTDILEEIVQNLTDLVDILKENVVENNPIVKKMGVNGWSSDLIQKSDKNNTIYDNYYINHNHFSTKKSNTGENNSPVPFFWENWLLKYIIYIKNIPKNRPVK